jgi:hypothetical protein
LVPAFKEELMEKNCAEKLRTQLCFNVVEECVWFNVFIQRLPKHVLNKIYTKKSSWAGRNIKNYLHPKKT